MLWLAAVALAWCQGTVTFESGVATFESGEEWVMGPSDTCTPYTIISPDGSDRGKARVRVPREAGKKNGTVSPRVVQSTPSLRSSCDQAYRSKTVDITFEKEVRILSKEQKGQLAALVMEKPDLVLVRRYVEEGKGRNSSGMGDARVAAVRTYFDGILATRPGFAEERRPAADPEGLTQMGVTAIYRMDCQEARRVSAVGKDKEQMKEGHRE